MKYQEFTKQVAAKIQAALGGDYTVELKSILKNNDVKMTGVLIHSTQAEHISPNIYLDHFYEQYQDGISMSSIVEQLMDVYHHTISSKTVSEVPTLEWEDCKEKIIFRLVNQEKNENVLKNCPHMPYMDLAITFHYLYSKDANGIRTIRITNKVFNRWGISNKELLKTAMENTPRFFPCRLQPMEDIIKRLFQNECESQEDDMDTLLDELFEPPTNNMPGSFVLSNHSGINGASVILYPHVLEEYANQFDSDLFILPSSIHEVILLPNQPDSHADRLTQMVREVNASEVSEEEILSDHVYRYSRDKHTILY